MATKPKYTELTFKRINHSLVGYDIVSEKHENGETTLFLKLKEKAPVSVPAKPKRKRRTKAQIEADKAIEQGLLTQAAGQ